MEFKGTKGKWFSREQAVVKYGYYIESEAAFIGEAGGGLQGDIETKANALLISKSPEMHAMILEHLESGRLTKDQELKAHKLLTEATKI